MICLLDVYEISINAINDHKVHIICELTEYRAGRTAQWVKAFADKPDHLSSIFEMHMVEGENRHQFY